MKGHELKVKMRVDQGPILGAPHQQVKANQSTDYWLSTRTLLLSCLYKTTYKSRKK